MAAVLRMDPAPEPEAEGDGVGESMTITADEMEAMNMPPRRRTEEMLDLLVAMVRRTGFPIAEKDASAARVMCSVILLEDIDEGEVLFEEGSESSDIYLVLSGSVNVCKKSVPRPINKVTRGKVFGEMALLHSDPVRHSSIVAAEYTRLGRLDAADIVRHKVDLALFQHAALFYKDLRDMQDSAAAEAAGAFRTVSLDVRKVMATAKKPPDDRSIAELDHMLDTMKHFPIFDPQTGKKFLRNTSQRRAVCAVLHARTFEPGRCVCAEGDEGHTMYIVLYGRLAVSTINHTSGESQHLKDLIAGQDFGELALLGDNVRTATVVSTEFSILLELQRPDYDATFRQADEEEIIEKVQNLTVCPLFNNMSLKKILRMAYGSKIMTFSKDQTILTEGVRSAQIFFVISGLVAVTTVCRTPTQTFLVSLGNRQSGSILGVEAALDRDSQSHFTYVALSEVRVLACKTAALTRRCTKEFTARLMEYAEACLTPAAINRMVLVETDWIKTRNQHHLAATGLRPMPPPPLADDESRHGGAAMRMASVQSLAKLVPPSMSLPASVRLPQIGHAHSHGNADTENGNGARVDGSTSELDEGDVPVANAASLAMLNAIDAAESEIELVDRGMKDLKDRMGSLIELRHLQSGRATPTPKDIAEMPGEAYRRSLQMRLWDPLVRLNHLSRTEKQKEREAGESTSTVGSTAAAAAHKDAALGGAPVVQVDLSRRLPKQFGMFTEMVYGVTVLWATVSCNTTGVIPGLAWHYFLSGLFKGFDEQAQMRGLLRSENRAVTNESSVILVGGMPHTKSYSQKPDGNNRAAALVCDVAMRMIEDVEASNKHHQNMLIELEHQAEIANSVSHGGPTSPGASGGIRSRSDVVTDHKSFDVSIRIGISSGSVAINVFGTKSPVYFGACGSEVDTARLLALAQPEVGANTPDSGDAGDTGSAHGSEPDGDHGQGTAATTIGTMAVLSDSTNELVKDGYLTAPATQLQKVDAHGNRQDVPSAMVAALTPNSPTSGTPNAGVATATGSGDADDVDLSGWILSGKKESFDVGPGMGTATAAAVANTDATAQTTQESPNLTAGVGSAAGNSPAVATARSRSLSNSTGSGAKAVKSRSTGTILPRSAKTTGPAALRISHSPRRPEHVFRAAQSQLRASARCAPAARQMLSPRMLSARLRPTVSARVRPSGDTPASVDTRSRSTARTRPQPSLRVVSPMSLYGRRPFGLQAGQV